MENIKFDEMVKSQQVNCPCCGGSALRVMDLPGYPLTEFFRDSEDSQNPYGFVDQVARFCIDCNHLFLQSVLDASQIYRNYITSSISSRGAVVCIENFVRFIEKAIGDLSPFTIIDIGGNDSTLLEYFLVKCKNLINIDPNASTRNKSIELRRHFLEQVDFSEFENGLPKIFVSSHTIEHLEDPVKLLANLSKVIGERDYLYLQFPSLEMLVKQKRFDQICHQHINYFSLKSIATVLEREGLQINDFEFDSSHFGTLRLMLTRKRTNMIVPEKFSSSYLSDSFENFRKYYEHLNALMEEVFYEGQGFGAGLMVPTLAYHLPLINRLARIIDENPARIGKRFISLRPQIEGAEHLDLTKPVLITSISTKDAARSIFSKLVSRGIRDICIPTMVT